jgi:hypothetical protein
MNHDMIWGFGLQEQLSPGHLEFELFALAQHSQLACDGAFLLGAQQPNSQFKTTISTKLNCQLFHVSISISNIIKLRNSFNQFFPTYPGLQASLTVRSG